MKTGSRPNLEREQSQRIRRRRFRPKRKILKGVVMKTTPRRVFALLLALVLLLPLCACAQKTQTEPDEPKMSTDKVGFLTAGQA